jgi:hypothetical protein
MRRPLLPQLLISPAHQFLMTYRSRHNRNAAAATPVGAAVPNVTDRLCPAPAASLLAYALAIVRCRSGGGYLTSQANS